MTRNYTAPQFFRQTDNALLKRFFHERDLLLDFDFDSMKATKTKPLFEAFMALPETDRQKMDAIFQGIYNMGCEKGFVAILDEAKYKMADRPNDLSNLIERLSDIQGYQNKAMIAYLDYQELWRGATHFHHADTLIYWRKRGSMGHTQARVHEPHREELSQKIGEYFHRTEGRGKNCIVEAFRRGEKDYFFAYPEDYAQQSPEWIDNTLDRRSHKPAFEVVFVYEQEQGTLDLNYRGNNKAIEPLQGMFAATILGLEELPPNPKDGRVYDLKPLGRRDFSFKYDPKNGIKKVVLHKLRLSAKAEAKEDRGGERITLEADKSKGGQAIYDLLDRAAQAFPLPLHNITYAEMTATVSTKDGKDKPFLIRLTYPNSCSLPYDELGLKLRQMLIDSGLEPRVPNKDEA